MLLKTFNFSDDVFDLFFLFKEEPHVFFLDSSLTASANGRYSILGFDPFDVIEGTDLSSFGRFKKDFLRFQSPAGSSLPFQGGAVGYLSYDLGMDVQGLRSLKPFEDALPLFHFGLYDVVLTVDHLEQKLYVTSSGFPEMDPSLRERRAGKRLAKVVERLKDLSSTPNVHRDRSKKERIPEALLKSNVTRDQYVQAVERALQRIREGDIYEINLSHKITVDDVGCFAGVKPWEMYACLRELSPSHFSAFFDGGDHHVLSTSPERFLRLKEGVAQIRPMKGTRPRGRTPEEDTLLRQELMHSPKEIAELLMVTDLERNDLGRVCEFGSVKVREMRVIEEYRTVFQATSTVEGRLRRDRSCFDLIEACFPGGSVTGCPKIRAMQLIDELEASRRGIYTGAFGYIDFSGNLDFNILIRTLLLTKNEISFHVGGGIVADSQPSMEYDETWVKAKALIECLNECGTRQAISSY